MVKKQGLIFNLKVFDRLGWREICRFNFEEKPLNKKEFSEAIRIINQAFGVELDGDLLKTPIGEEKWLQNKKRSS
jgi:hypothetical protein